jgi:succinyl-diaminopimelate desuccinylase
MKDELVTLCQELVRIPSWDREERGEAKVAHRVGKSLEKHHIETEFFSSHPNIDNLVARMDGVQTKRTLLFNGHGDVVPAGSLDDWSVDPFSAEIHEERIYGRGSLDMKGGVAAMTISLCALRDIGAPLRGTVILNVVGDEEKQGELGTSWCIDNIWEKIRADACIVGEPTGVSPLGQSLCIGEKGVVWVKIITKGEKAHGSVPLMGKNAITIMLQFLTKLLEQGPPTVEPPIKRDALVRQIASALGVEPSTLEPLLRESKTPNILYAAVEALTKTTLNVGIISGGVAANIVPDRCESQLDFRILPGQDPQEIIDALARLAKELGFEHAVEIKLINAFESTSVPNYEKDQLVANLFSVSKELIGPTFYSMFPAATDGRLLRKAGISSTAVYGPGNTSVAHAADECIAIKDMVNVAKVYAVSTIRFLGLDIE